MKQTKWNIVYATTIALMFATAAIWMGSIFLSLQQSTHATTTTTAPGFTPGGQIIDEKKLVESVRTVRGARRRICYTWSWRTNLGTNGFIWRQYLYHLVD